LTNLSRYTKLGNTIAPISSFSAFQINYTALFS
jgi:hypothetical protein